MTVPRVVPVLRGRDLAGRPVELPGDLPGAPTVLVAGFTQDQQRDIDTWVAALAGLDVLEVVLIPAGQERRRRTIEGGMAFFLRDEAVRRRTWCLYGDLDAALVALDVPGRAQVLAMVVDRDGTVHQLAIGPPTPAAVQAVRRWTSAGDHEAGYPDGRAGQPR